MEKTTQARAWFEQLKTSTQSITLEIDGWEDRHKAERGVLHSFYVFPDGSVYREQTHEDVEHDGYDWSPCGDYSGVFDKEVYDNPVELLEELAHVGEFGEDTDYSEVYKALTAKFNYTPYNALKAIIENGDSNEEPEDIIKALTQKASATA